MHKNRTLKLMMLAIAMLTILSLPTRTSAQEPTPSASAATPTSKPTPTATPSDEEIKRVAVRALDKLEETQKASKAKDSVISEQDKALAESEEGKKAATQAAINFRDAYEQQKEATAIAKDGWKAEQDRVRQLEKKVRGSNNRTKWMAVGAAAAVIATYLLK
jgi:hypothetical protein